MATTTSETTGSGWLGFREAGINPFELNAEQRDGLRCVVCNGTHNVDGRAEGMVAATILDGVQTFVHELCIGDPARIAAARRPLGWLPSDGDCPVYGVRSPSRIRSPSYAWLADLNPDRWSIDRTAALEFTLDAANHHARRLGDAETAMLRQPYPPKVSAAGDEGAIGMAARELDQAHAAIADVALEWADREPGRARDAQLNKAIAEWKAASQRFAVTIRGGK